MINVKSFEFNPFAEITYVLSDNENHCIIIDPGCYNAYEKEELAKYIRKNQLKPQAIWLTHSHLDHIFGVSFLKQQYNIPVIAHQMAPEGIRMQPLVSQMYGIPSEACPLPDKLLNHGDQIMLGNIIFEVIYCPGHSADGIVFYQPESGIAMVGDVLFAGSIGRTDLPGGDYNTLIQNIRTRLFVLPPETKVYPGHGPPTKIGEEIRTNPFFQ
ncbi:MAG: MBL fold metallo-hydrolase [Flavobacteriales bacterium]|nr:MBL fold metallo-hydrolase [Flavobacteriales bacterium]